EANLRLQSEITERNQAEEKFRNFVLQSIDGIALCDDDFIIIEWNQQMEQITGLARSEVIGTPIWDAVYQTVPVHIRNPQLYEALQKEYSQVFSDKSSGYVRRKNNFKVQHENGILRDVQVFNFPFKTSSGVMLGISCRDVTERKQAERELVETRDQLENLIETSVDPIRITDERGSIVRVNHAYAKLLGYTPAEMVGKHVAEMAPAEPGVYETINGDPITVDEGFFSETQDMVARLLTTGRVSSFHGLSQRADGIVLITEESNALLYNDQREVTGAVGILRDITERARTENNLKRLATAVAAADEIIFITDSAGIIQYVNPAFTQVTGYCFDEVAGKTPAILKSGKQDTAF
ncbi:MAG: PAS domain S-box protein, partial [Deltaproteobacteria bacterium]|nr:PAS domain S-box protein [Deltaproteobacteria bacterium]